MSILEGRAATKQSYRAGGCSASVCRFYAPFPTARSSVPYLSAQMIGRQVVAIRNAVCEWTIL